MPPSFPSLPLPEAAAAAAHATLLALAALLLLLRAARARIPLRLQILGGERRGPADEQVAELVLEPRHHNLQRGLDARARRVSEAGGRGEVLFSVLHRPVAGGRGFPALNHLRRGVPLLGSRGGERPSECGGGEHETRIKIGR